MHVVLAISIAVLLIAALAALVLLRRAGDPRAALFAAAFGLLAGSGILALWSLGRRPLGFDLPTLALLLVLAGSGLCPFLVRVLWRTLRERDRSESLHWSSMETVRALADLSALSSLELGARIDRLLAIGCEHFDLEVGLVSRIEGDRYEVLAARAPKEVCVERGTTLPLDATWCRVAFGGARPFDLPDVAASAWADRARDRELPFAAYLGTVVRSGGRPFGTLAFASREPRGERFTATEKDLLTLLARWLGRELETRSAPAPAVAAAKPAPSPTPPAPAPRRQPGPGWTRVRVRPRPADRAGGARRPKRRERPALNAALRRLEPRIRRALGEGPTLELDLRAELEPAPTPGAPLDSIVLSLVAVAARALGGAGRVELATRDLEIAAPAPGVLPARAPDRYATIVVDAAGPSVDPDALAAAFEPATEAALAGDRSRLPLPTLYRLLQRRGGDLSVEVERARRARFTVYLPRRVASAPASRVRVAASPPAPG